MTLYALGAFVLISLAQAQSSATWPMWVTNDYNCVIGCMSQYFTDASPPSTTDQYNNAMGCVKSTCAQETMDANIYQAQYIINMYNQIGSIYEPKDWQNGNIPQASGSSLTAPTGWAQTTVTTSYSNMDGWQTVTDTVWAPPPPTSTSDAGTTDTGAAPSDTGTGGSGTTQTSEPHSSSSKPASSGASGASAAATTSGGAGRAVDLGKGMGGMVVPFVGMVLGAAVVGL